MADLIDRRELLDSLASLSNNGQSDYAAGFEAAVAKCSELVVKMDAGLAETETNVVISQQMIEQGRITLENCEGWACAAVAEQVYRDMEAMRISGKFGFRIATFNA